MSVDTWLSGNTGKPAQRQSAGRCICETAGYARFRRRRL